MSHSPGPWTHEGPYDDQDGLAFHAIRDAKRRPVGDIESGGADARLIAAAPEMLELLREASAAGVNMSGIELDNVWMAKVAAIIASIDGRDPT